MQESFAPEHSCELFRDTLKQLLDGSRVSNKCGSYCQVSSVSWIAGSHHVLSIKHLLGQFWYGQRSVLLATTGCKWGNSRHGQGYQVVQVAICWGGKFESSEADVI